MLLTALLLLASPAEASVQTRDGIIQAYRQMVAEQDRDHDGRVSRAEWQAVVDRMFPPTPRPGEEASNYSEVRASSAGLLDYWDANGDSFFTFDEIVRPALESFACADRDRDGRVTEAEGWYSMENCPSITWTGTRWTTATLSLAASETAAPAR
jgi:hypothetical protein